MFYRKGPVFKENMLAILPALDIRSFRFKLDFPTEDYLFYNSSLRFKAFQLRVCIEIEFAYFTGCRPQRNLLSNYFNSCTVVGLVHCEV